VYHIIFTHEDLPAPLFYISLGLQWTKWHLAFSTSISLSSSTVIPPMVHIHIHLHILDADSIAQ